MKSNIRFKGKLKGYLSMPLYLMILFVVLNISMYFYDVRSGAVISVFLAIYGVAEGILFWGMHQKVANEIVNYATNYATVQKRLLNEFEIPYALLDYSGKILWVNDQFAELADIDPKKYHKSITTIFPTITREFLQKSDQPQNINIEKNDRRFRISINRIYFDAIASSGELLETDDAEEFLTALYLFDETELNRYMVENEEQKQVAALVYIDNYEEALNSIEDVKRSLLVALIDRRVNQYFAQYDALVRKTEKDKYFVVFKYKYLQQLEEDKFKLLEDVKSVKVGNEMAITLSIGVGIHRDSYNQSYD